MKPNAIDRANRFLLSLIGLLLVAAGVLAILLRAGALGASRRHTHLLSSTTRTYVDRNHGWFWLAVAGVALIVLLLSLRWLRGQLTHTRSTVHKVRSEGPGPTTLAPRAVAEALVQEIGGYRGVDDVKASYVTAPGNRRVLLTVDVAPDGDINAIRHKVESETIADLRRALEDEVPVVLTLALPSESVRHPG